MHEQSNGGVLAVDGLRVDYPAGRRRVEVVHGVDLRIERGKTLALVGESGSGKTTIARAIAGLIPAHGSIVFEGRDTNRPVARRPREVRRRIQYVFQNPDASLNPRRRVSYLIGRPIEFFFGLPRREVRRRVGRLLEDVHLDPRYVDRFPGELSGGERQRVAIAQALAAEPALILCDEIVSALDVSVQASILDLLREIQATRGLSYLFIAHDLAVVRWLAHHVVVLNGGSVMEAGAPGDVFGHPNHPYTQALLRSVPEPRVRELDVVGAAVAGT
jgi:peptide/nickel transport system ATP-binding protein